MTVRLPAAMMTSAILSLAVTSLYSAKATDNDTVGVTAIVEKYLKASGGPALQEFGSEQRKGTLLRYQTGQLPVEVIAKAPGLWRYDQTLAWGDRISCGFDGTRSWVADMHSVKPMEGHQFSDMRLLFDPQAPLKMRTWYPKMSVGDDGKIGERDVTTIIAVSAEGLSTILAFDKESGLLLRAGQMYFEDYRPVGAITRPYKILLGENDSTHFQMVMQFSKIDNGVAIDDSRFGYPDCVLSGTDAPLYTHRTQVEVALPQLEACVGVYQHSSDSGVTYAVTRQDNHLMIKRTGWPLPQEIRPQSETHYFMEFLNRDFYFVKDTTGLVTRLEIGNNGEVVATKIK